MIMQLRGSIITVPSKVFKLNNFKINVAKFEFNKSMYKKIPFIANFFIWNDILLGELYISLLAQKVIK